MNFNTPAAYIAIKRHIFFANRLIICIFASDKEKMRRGRDSKSNQERRIPIL
jgi:hypothetical protein